MKKTRRNQGKSRLSLLSLTSLIVWVSVGVWAVGILFGVAAGTHGVEGIAVLAVPLVGWTILVGAVEAIRCETRRCRGCDVSISTGMTMLSGLAALVALVQF